MARPYMKFNLGDKVRDKVTGFVGIAVSRTEWLNKCIRYGVAPPKVNKDGKIDDAQHFDEEQLELVKASVIVVVKDRYTGGPKPAPLRAADPTR